jgi:hypothetical protein
MVVILDDDGPIKVPHDGLEQPALEARAAEALGLCCFCGVGVDVDFGG